MTPLAAGFAVLGAYVLGGVPFSLLLGFVLGRVDIRARGSGNAGATNLGRVCGWRYFPLAFALDFGKGFAPLVLAMPALAQARMEHSWVLAATVMLALAPVAGHIYSPFLKFRGGKGVATTTGALAALLPLETAVAAAAWFAAFALTRTVGVASRSSFAAPDRPTKRPSWADSACFCPRWFCTATGPTSGRISGGEGPADQGDGTALRARARLLEQGGVS